MEEQFDQQEPLYFTKKEIWQRSFNFAIRVLRMIKQIQSGPIAWELSKQIVRSSTSIAGNIAEGSAGSSKKEFIRYMDIARKSAIETYNWFLFIEEAFGLQKRMVLLKRENVEIVKVLSSIVIKARANQ